MAFREIKGNSFIKCDAFWQPELNESFTGVLIDVNRKAKDNLSGQVRPLYLFAALTPKGEVSSFVLDKKPAKIKAGGIVGVNSSGEISQKIGANVAQFFGHTCRITYTAKEQFQRDGKSLPIKRFLVELDDEVAKGEHTLSQENGGKTVKYASYVQPDAKPIGVETEQAHPTANASPVPFDLPTGN